MNKIVASVGIIALGASGVQMVSAQNISTPPQKPWNVSATLRGFYDDNISARPSGPDKVDSFGFEVSPKIGLNWSDDQTMVAVGYRYDAKWYEDKPVDQTSHWRQDHTFDLALTHAFNERYNTSLRDSFVIGQEPDLLRARNAFDTFQPVPGDNIRNYGSILFDAQLTPLLGTEIGYDNAFYDYHDRGGDAFAPSLSGLLDRIEHTVHLEGNWQVMPETKAVIGYRFRQTGYTGNEIIGPGVMSEDRDSRTHTGYLGLDHNFRSDFSGSVRVGAQATDYYNDPNTDGEISPYVQASMRYTYAEQSYAELGFTYDRNATDLVGATANGFTVDEQSAVLYGSINHQITPNIYGSIVGQYQNSTLNGGAYDNDSENYYLAGVNLQYRFNPYLSSEIGYNFDHLDSDIPNRTFSRNRVYIGLTASY